MHQPYKSDYEYVMESYSHPTNVDFETVREKEQKVEEEVDKIDLVSENLIHKVDEMLNSIPTNLIRKD